MQRAGSLEKTLMLGKIEGWRKQRMRWLDGIIDSMDMKLTKFQEMVKDREAWHSAVYEVARVIHDWMTENNNTFRGLLLCLAHSKSWKDHHHSPALLMCTVLSLLQASPPSSLHVSLWGWSDLSPFYRGGKWGSGRGSEVLLSLGH